VTAGQPSPSRRQRDLTRRLRPFEWRQLGFLRHVAGVFAAEVVTLERLATMTKEQLSALPGVGRATLRRCAAVLGKDLPCEETLAGFTYWAGHGVRRFPASELLEKNLRTVEELRCCGTETLLGVLKGLLPRDRAAIEAILGPDLLNFGAAMWRRRGVSNRVAPALERAGFLTVDDLGPVSREEFLSRDGLGEHALRQCEAVIGRLLTSSLQLWIETGLSRRVAWKLSSRRIHSIEQLDRCPPEELRKLGIEKARVAALVSLALVPAGHTGELRFWLEHGLSYGKARILAGLGREKVEPMTREDLLLVPEIGPHTLYRCEKALGRRIPSRVERQPGWSYWQSRGIRGKALLALLARGIRTAEDLRRLDLHQILALPGFGPKTVVRIEKTLRVRLSNADAWVSLGLPGRVARLLGRAGFFTLEALAAATREELAYHGFPPGALQRCEALLGRPLPSGIPYWSAQGVPKVIAWKLSRWRVLTVADLRRLSAHQLQQLGFDRDDTKRLLRLASRN